MKILLKILTFFVIFSGLFLSWPDYSRELVFACNGEESVYEECNIDSRINYDDLRMGGGLHWVQKTVCFSDGVLLLGDDTCSFAYERYFMFAQATIGAFLVTTIFYLSIFERAAINKFLNKIYK